MHFLSIDQFTSTIGKVFYLKFVDTDLKRQIEKCLIKKFEVISFHSLSNGKIL